MSSHLNEVGYGYFKHLYRAKTIDCSNPKGFSQKAHCRARKLRQAGIKTKSKAVK